MSGQPPPNGGNRQFGGFTPRANYSGGRGKRPGEWDRLSSAPPKFVKLEPSGSTPNNFDAFGNASTLQARPSSLGFGQTPSYGPSPQVITGHSANNSGQFLGLMSTLTPVTPAYNSVASTAAPPSTPRVAPTTAGTNNLNKNDKTPIICPPLFPISRDIETRKDLSLLCGPSIEVIVGGDGTWLAGSNDRQTWWLPKALVSHYSSFLRAQCTRESKEPEKTSVTLPDVDPTVFSKFVEWMYYGSYVIPGFVRDLVPEELFPTLASQAWVLGDKLNVQGFKNYAMVRLYVAYVSQNEPRAVRMIDVKYSCSHSASESLLQQFFLDVVATHFTNPNRVNGTVQELDAILQEYPDAGTFLLESLMTDQSQRQFIKAKEAYMTPKDETDSG